MAEATRSDFAVTTEMKGQGSVLTTERGRFLRQLVVVSLLLAAAVHFRVELSEALFSAVDMEETIFAPGYSRKAWKQIGTGDTIEKVTSLLGEPLKKYLNADGTTYMYSTQGPRDTNYRVRTIIFDKDGRVLEKEEGFYFD